MHSNFSIFFNSQFNFLAVFLCVSMMPWKLFQISKEIWIVSRSTRPKVFYEKDVLRNFAKCRCFPVNFAEFLRTPFLTEHLRWLLLGLIQEIFDNFILTKTNMTLYRRTKIRLIIFDFSIVTRKNRNCYRKENIFLPCINHISHCFQMISHH